MLLQMSITNADMIDDADNQFKGLLLLFRDFVADDDDEDDDNDDEDDDNDDEDDDDGGDGIVHQDQVG